MNYTSVKKKKILIKNIRNIWYRAKEARHQRVHMIWFHTYKVGKQEKLINVREVTILLVRRRWNGGSRQGPWLVLRMSYFLIWTVVTGFVHFVKIILNWAFITHILFCMYNSISLCIKCFKISSKSWNIEYWLPFNP